LASCQLKVNGALLTSQSLSGTSQSCSLNWTPTANGNYNYQTLIIDADNNSTTCQSGSYCADSQAPPTPTGEALSCWWDNDGGGYRVTYSWNNVNDNGCAGLGSTAYWSQISTDNKFGTVSGWYNSWSSVISRSSTGTNGLFQSGDVVYAHVRSRDRVDNQSSWSSSDSINIGSGCTNAPTATPIPTATPLPTPIITNTPTPTPVPVCNWRCGDGKPCGKNVPAECPHGNSCNFSTGQCEYKNLNAIEGYIFKDANSNNVHDRGEAFVPATVTLVEHDTVLNPQRSSGDCPDTGYLFAKSPSDPWAVKCTYKRTSTLNGLSVNAPYNYVFTGGFGPDYYHSGQHYNISRYYKITVRPRGSWPRGWKAPPTQKTVTFSSSTGQTRYAHFPLKPLNPPKPTTAPTATAIPTPTPTTAPVFNWFRLKNTSFDSLSAEGSNILPFTKTHPFDKDDSSDPYLIISDKNSQGGGIITSPPTIRMGHRDSMAQYSATNWYTTSRYSVSTTVDVAGFLNYVKAKKDYYLTTATDLKDLKPNKINIIARKGKTVTVNINSSNDIKITSPLVVIVDGNINIQGDFKTTTKSVAFLATGTINIYPNVGEVDGLFIAGRTDLSPGKSSSATPLKVRGNLIANQPIDPAKRNRSDDMYKPSLFVVFQPKLYLDLLPYLSSVRFDWQMSK